MLLLLYCFANFLVTCLDFCSGDGSLDISKDRIDGNGVFRAGMEALDHVEIKVVPEVYVLYVII